MDLTKNYEYTTPWYNVPIRGEYCNLSEEQAVRLRVVKVHEVVPILVGAINEAFSRIHELEFAAAQKGKDADNKT